MEAFALSKEAKAPVSVLKVPQAHTKVDGRIGLRKKPASGHTVRFASNTHIGIESDLALSITRHRIKDGKYVEYTIVIHQKGYQIFPIHKRYKQFEALHANMKKENKDYELPHLPKKRWFKTNKWDDEYHIDRRFALQLYLRLMVKFYSKTSQVLRKFLELKEDLTEYNSRESLQVLSERERQLLDKMNVMNSNVLKNLPSLARKVDADAAAVLEGISLPPPASSYHTKESGDVLSHCTSKEATQESSGGTSIKGSLCDTRDVRDTGDSYASISPGKEKSGEEREGGEGSHCSEASEEGDYIQDSIASSWHVTKKRNEGGGAQDDENLVAAQLNQTLLQNAKSSESLAGRDMGIERERARSVEFLSEADGDADSIPLESLGRLAKALAMQSKSTPVDNLVRSWQKIELKAEEEDFEDEFDV